MMMPAMSVALLWLLFAGSHISLGVLRPRMVGRIGEVGFALAFSLVACATFTALVTTYGAARFTGLPGIGLGMYPVVRWLLMTVAVCGLALAMPALVVYPRLPSALFGQSIQAPRGIERITRHPFFAGSALFAAAHTLLASHLVGTVFFGGWMLFSVIGAWHQDRKLAARRGRAYAEYCAATSAIPFAAIIAGKQRIVWNELPVGAFGVGLALALAARHWHDHLFARNGLGLAMVVIVGGAIAALSAWRRSQRNVAPIARNAPRESAA